MLGLGGERKWFSEDWEFSFSNFLYSLLYFVKENPWTLLGEITSQITTSTAVNLKSAFFSCVCSHACVCVSAGHFTEQPN